MTQPPVPPPSGPDFGRRPPAGGFAPQQDYSHPDFPTATSAALPAAGMPPAPAPAPRERRSPALGFVALFLVVIATVIHIPLMLRIVATIQAYDTSDRGQQTYTEAEATIPTLLALQLVPGALGLLAFILGIIAASTRRGTAAGVVALIAAVLMPILILLAFFLQLQFLLTS